MNIEQAILEKIRQLPLEKQQEVLDFSTSLLSSFETSTKLPPILGSNKDIISIVDDDELTPQERVKNWLDFVATLPKTSANLPDEALHRDSMYD